MVDFKKPLSKDDIKIPILFFLIPTLMLIYGYFLFPSYTSPADQPPALIVLFFGLIFLGIGFLWRGQKISSMFKIIGWFLSSFFWALMPSFLYHSEGGDIFNATVCIIGVYVLFYMAYHEWLSIKTKEFVSCLNWIAGGTFIAGIIYFTIDTGIIPELKSGLIEVVATHSTILLQVVGLDAIREGSVIIFNEVPITIIFACTAVQAMVLFVGMIGALKINITRKIMAIIVTVIPIYFLNLVRNASVVYLIGSGTTDFHMAHNVLAKIGALITLIALLFLTFKIVPKLFDEISCIIDLPKRKGPIENLFFRILGKKSR